MTDPTKLAAWFRLQNLAPQMAPIRELIKGERSFLRWEGAAVHADFSRQRVNAASLQALIDLAIESGVEEKRAAMFSGGRINSTENRSVLHTALRLPQNAVLNVEGVDIVHEVHSVLDHMTSFSEQVRSGAWRGCTGERITRVINIGIGGSDLGPAMAYQALNSYADPNISLAFVANVDPADIEQALAGSNPEHTLFIVASKTFTTAETMANAQYAKNWLLKHFPNMTPSEVIPRHFVALSTNAAAVSEFGIDPSNMFGFWDWVGGRYSMDSAIGLSTMIAIGDTAFRDLLAGFHAMDEHFKSAPLNENIPALMGLLAIWNRNFLDIETTAVLPYSQDLARFPAYLQQLTMESNGKSSRIDGSPVTYQTGSIYWGEPGTNGQHSFYQLLHQGTSVVACDFIVVANNHGEPNNQQKVLVANALAQAAVLALGVTESELMQSGISSELAAHKVMPGDRPVSILMIDHLTPFTLGSLVSLYEHSVFVQGVIWGINSFDQWGVELGKKVANEIESAFVNQGIRKELDESTRESIDLYLKLVE